MRRSHHPGEGSSCREQFLGGVAVVLLALSTVGSAVAACRDNVVLVHGNTGNPSDFANTVAELKRRGYVDAEISRRAGAARSVQPATITTAAKKYRWKMR